MNIPVVGIKPVGGPRDVEVIALRDHIGRYGFVKKGASVLVTMNEAQDYLGRGVATLPQGDPGDEQPEPVAAVKPLVEKLSDDPVKIDGRTKAGRAAKGR